MANNATKPNPSGKTPTDTSAVRQHYKMATGAGLDKAPEGKKTPA